MTAASALISGNEAVPQLAEQAVHAALAAGGDSRANGVILFLSPEFARHAQPAVLAAARAAQCTQVFGGIAAGLCTERGWVVDRPAAAALVLGGGASLQPAETAGDHPLLCCTASPFPSEWANSRRYGLLYHGGSNDGAVWQQGRLVEHGAAEVRVGGATARIARSHGLCPLGDMLHAERVRGYDLLSIGGLPALDSLLRSLPAAWRDEPPLHQINLLVGTADCAAGDAPQAVAIISANADRSLGLSAPLRPGDAICWAIRQPLAAEADMRQSLDLACGDGPRPDFALFFSCIGRGPYFYGGDDRDLAALSGRYPGMPLLGAYGTGQIACGGRHSRQLQNSVVTALFNES